jgi:2-acylglycerol O-acyltransferase 2
MSSRIEQKIAMKPMAWHRHAVAYVTLGFLCGWYYFLIILYPVLIIAIFCGSIVAGVILATFVTLSLIPLPKSHWNEFMYGYFFDVWREYFQFETDLTAVKGKLSDEKKYMFFEYPHGIFPLGQFVSASVIRDVTPNKMICGTAADIVLKFPIMRQIMSWIGTRSAQRQSIAKIYAEGHHCAVCVGGIAEMYLVSPEKEEIFLLKRKNTIKTAIQEGANIIPAFFFGNTRLFNIAGASGSDSFLSRFSRKIRASIVLFYGRHYLPVPFRHPIRITFGEVVEIKQNDNPSEEEILEVMERVKKSVEGVYERRPEWEKRPLVIS